MDADKPTLLTDPVVAAERERVRRTVVAHCELCYFGDWRLLHGAYDGDNDGLLTADEVRTLCRDAGVRDAGDAGWWVPGIFHALDWDRGGKIGAAEFELSLRGS